MSKIKTIFIVGPTASGKTDLSIRLAKELNGEIISADSMQIYKGIHIASAAPDSLEMQGIKHHLLEFLDTSEQFSVADYVKLAREKITEISRDGKTPIIVGGTGLYINSLLDNTEFIEADNDYSLRKKLEDEFLQFGAEAMLEKLKEIDSDAAAKLHKNDKKRIIRALEVYYLTGNTKSYQNEISHNNEGFIEPLVLGITYADREKLYDRINMRVDIMLKNGLLDEAKRAFSLSNNVGGFQAIGHKELFPYFKGECDLNEAVENLKMQTRRYAKRQLTWFRRDQRINWFYPDRDTEYFDKALNLSKNFLKE